MADDGEHEMDVVHRMNQGYLWGMGRLKIVLSNRGLVINVKK